MATSGAGRETESAEATYAVMTELTNWEKVVDLAQAEFGEGRLAEESTWQEVVLIPKGGGEYQCIGLVEVVWKVVAVILNLRLTASTTFHGVLHGFQAGSVTCTAILKAKLIQQLEVMREEVL